MDHRLAPSTSGRRAIRSVCVFCGSRPGSHPDFAIYARRLGQDLAARGIRLVYGGGAVGLMGLTARAAVEAGGTVIGVIPKFLDAREVAQPGLAELHRVDNMHERKAKMSGLADAFICLPGGIGTLEELIEMLSWAHLGLHDKPMLLFNQHGFWEPLRALIAQVVRGDFAGDSLWRLFDMVDKYDELLAWIEKTPAGTAVAEDFT